jgi:hypothetical protein
MTSSRLDKIRGLLADDPQDVFLRYSLAMELEKNDQHAESQVILAELMAEQPPYVPAFFMAAQHVARRGSVASARTILRDGIEQARQQGDAHAAGEMAEFLAGLGALGE